MEAALWSVDGPSLSNMENSDISIDKILYLTVKQNMISVFGPGNYYFSLFDTRSKFVS
jgi:hypothetical protein